MEGTWLSGKSATCCQLEERAAGELFTGAAEVSPRAVRTVAGVAESHLGYDNRKGLWAFWVVQYG